MTDPQTGELAFGKKPHRMTSPPNNAGEWLEFYEGVNVRLETDPKKIAVLCREATWGSVFDFHPTAEQIEETWKEIQSGKVLGAAFEFPAFAFVFRSSRVSMDQLLRLREAAGAAHTTRDNDFRDFNIIVPPVVSSLRWDKNDNFDGATNEDMARDALYDRCMDFVNDARALYSELVDNGVPPEAARYIALPMGYQGDYVMVMNLRALIKECEHRLCNGLVQAETNLLARIQRDLVVNWMPEVAPLLRSRCEKVGSCAKSTMLFPPCGAFGSVGFIDAMEAARTAHNPEKHLYPPEQNDSMEFAEWDYKRVTKYKHIPLERVRYASDPDDQDLS